MPNQGKIINAVNNCLQQKPNIDFELNRTGICSGLAALYIKYALKNNAAQFFNLLEGLSSLPEHYNLGDNPSIDDFIIQIEKAFRPAIYTTNEIQQGELEKILSIANKPLTNEFNLGLITEDTQWKEIFKKIARNQRSYFIASEDHAISMSFLNGKYTLYDPNYSKNTKTFASTDELIEEIKNCFDYKDPTFGLTIRTYAHPNASLEHYPTHKELHDGAFTKEANPKSSSFALRANDYSTLNYFFKVNKIDFKNLNTEFVYSSFNDLLIQQPKSESLKQALLNGIYLTYYAGNHKEAQKLLKHYQQHYTSPEDAVALKNSIAEVFTISLYKNFGLLKKARDYRQLLAFIDPAILNTNSISYTHYNHLQLLTLIHLETNPTAVQQFLSTIPPKQLIKQIQCAALTNQHQIVHVLFEYLTHNKIDPKHYTPIFTQEILTFTDTNLIKKLLDYGFPIDTKAPELLALCMQRKNKAIFERYARAWSTKVQQTSLWEHLDSHQYQLIDLKAPIASLPLLLALIFLGKNEHIKKTWQENIPEELIKQALSTAIFHKNKEMCSFLQEKLAARHSQLDADTLEFLYDTGLQDENLFILTTLTQFNFNVLRTVKEIKTLLTLCSNYNNFTIIEACFGKASPKIKSLILDFALSYAIQPLINLCVQKDPELFNEYLNESLTNFRNLNKLNRVVNQLPPNTLHLKHQVIEQKQFIKTCINNKWSHLANVLSKNLIWDEQEQQELMQNTNENSLILILQIIPQLKEQPNLLHTLLQNNLIKVVHFLLTEDQKLEPVEIEQIVSISIKKNWLFRNSRGMLKFSSSELFITA